MNANCQCDYECESIRIKLTAHYMHDARTIEIKNEIKHFTSQNTYKRYARPRYAKQVDASKDEKGF